VNVRPGLALAAICLCVYGTCALAVDVPRANFGFKSDEATYYMMGLSLVHDRDLTYRKEDLVRVWREFQTGPAGVFLKRGRTAGGGADPDKSRYFYGKSFVYPLFAAPLIAVFGTNGFLLLNALCMALVLLCGYLFLHARSRAWPSAVLAAGFVMGSVVPVYAVQMMPEVFNFTLVFAAYFCWLYKEVAAPEGSPRGTRWLFTPKSDLAMAILLGIATFSKITNAALFAAPVVWWAWLAVRRSGGAAAAYARPASIGRNLLAVAAFVVVGGGLFAVNKAISGEWNYQGGGGRRSYTFEFPLQTENSTTLVGADKSREDLMTPVIFNRRTFVSNLTHNAEYFFVGRYAGMLPYFFPGLFAMLLMLSSPRRRPGWQWLALGCALAQGLIFVIFTPYTWSGGGVGNRYFFGGYAVMLFLLPPVELLAAAFVPWVVGGLFVGGMVLTPFETSFHPNANSQAGLIRALPVELTLLNDLPVFTEPERGRVWFGDTQGDPAFLVSFLDDNAYNREMDKSFWTRGDSRADLVYKADLPIRRAIFQIAAGAVPVDVSIDVAGHETRVHLEPNGTERVTMAMPEGVIYEKERQDVHLWNVRIVTRGGFTPIFVDPQANDARYLGARIKPMLDTK
jgi:hypothetical protein